MYASSTVKHKLSGKADDTAVRCQLLGPASLNSKLTSKDFDVPVPTSSTDAVRSETPGGADAHVHHNDGSETQRATNNQANEVNPETVPFPSAILLIEVRQMDFVWSHRWVYCTNIRCLKGHTEWLHFIRVPGIHLKTHILPKSGSNTLTWLYILTISHCVGCDEKYWVPQTNRST